MSCGVLNVFIVLFLLLEREFICVGMVYGVGIFYNGVEGL